MYELYIYIYIYICQYMYIYIYLKHLEKTVFFSKHIVVVVVVFSWFLGREFRQEHKQNFQVYIFVVSSLLLGSWFIIFSSP